MSTTAKGKYGGKKFARDWVGVRVELLREITTGGTVIPAGATGLVHCTGKSAGTVYVTFDACSHCGVKARCNNVPYGDLKDIPADTYRELLSEALRVAGHSDEKWNQRFIAALKNRGLQIGPINAERDPRYPGDFAYKAPEPFSVQPGFEPPWPKGSCIVFKPTEDQHS
jgi:hypothetical protein